VKGDGEAHPYLSPKDEFADYGTWDKGHIAGFKPKEKWMLQMEPHHSIYQMIPEKMSGPWLVLTTLN
jgi:hypothetical protein